MSGSSPLYAMAHNSVVAFSATARTSTPTSVVVPNQGNFNACLIFVSTTAVTASPSVVFNFDVYNDKGNTYVEVLDGAAVATVSEAVYALGAKDESSDLRSTIPPTKKIRIRPVHGNADSITYQVSVFWYRA